MSFNKAVISGLSIGIILISIKILSGSSVYALIAASLLALAISVQTGHSLKSNISDAFNVIKNCFTDPYAYRCYDSSLEGRRHLFNVLKLSA